MTCFVTGIVETSDISQLEIIVGGVPGVDLTKLSVITTAPQTDEHDSSFLNFLHVGGPVIESDTFGGLAGRDTAIMTSGGGTGVPGISSSGSGLEYLERAEVVDVVGDLPIPADEADNYNDALRNGRVVIAYQCLDADAGPVETAMRSAGVRHVKTFRSS